MVRNQSGPIYLPRSRFIAVGGAAALAAGAGTLGVRLPARASLPPGWSTQRVGNVTQLLYNGSLIVSVAGIVNHDKSGTLSAYAPKGPAMSMTLPPYGIFGVPTDLGNGSNFTPISAGSANYQSPNTQGNGFDNGNGLVIINDSKWGQLSYDSGHGGGGGGGGHPREGVIRHNGDSLWGCVIATCAAEIGTVGWAAGAFAALQAAGWLTMAIPPMALIAIIAGGIACLGMVVAAYVVCHGG
jgi:hypothetical protein